MSLELLEQALLMEDVSGLDDILNVAKESGMKVPKEIDLLTIRKMMIRYKMNELEIKKTKELKSAVMESWDKKIKSIEEDNESLKAIIDHWINETNGGKPAAFPDVGTAGTRKVPHSVSVKDPILFRHWLEQRGKLQLFLKPQELDVTAAKNDIVTYIDDTADRLAEEELKKLVEADPERKWSKKELAAKKEGLLKEIIPLVVASAGLQEGVIEYQPESKTLSLRFIK